MVYDNTAFLQNTFSKKIFSGWKGWKKYFLQKFLFLHLNINILSK